MTQRVTFIVGNGLDISLGLATRYSDFYSYIEKLNKNTKNQIYQAIAKDPETWAEFELALGAHTQVIEESEDKKDREKASQKLHDAFAEVLEDLGDYLEEQVEKSVDNIPQYNIQPSDFYAGLLGESSLRITNSLGRPLNMNFITLNYTDTLERMLTSRQLMAQKGIHISQIHHAHGKLSEYITMGVSNESQISPALEGDARDDLIKPRLLASMRDDLLNTTINIIRNSEIIVLFGTSYAETDEYIWQQVIDWLKLEANRIVILHDYNPEYMDKPTRNPARIKQLDNEARNRLLNHTQSLEDEEKVDLRAQILVVRNTRRLFKT